MLRGQPNTLTITANDYSINVNSPSPDYETVCHASVSGGLKPYGAIRVDKSQEDLTQAGSYPVTFSVTDHANATATKVVTITVTDVRAPQGQSLASDEPVDTADVEVDLDSYTVKELREIAKKSGVATTGTKSELIERIKGE